MKRGTYRDARRGENIPDDYILIPMYLTTEDHRKLCRKLDAEKAKDITPKEENP